MSVCSCSICQWNRFLTDLARDPVFGIDAERKISLLLRNTKESKCLEGRNIDLSKIISLLHLEDDKVRLKFANLLDNFAYSILTFDEIIELVGNIVSNSLYGHFIRNSLTRKTNLGAEEEIALDNITGYYLLESDFIALHKLLLGVFKRSMKSDKALKENEKKQLIRNILEVFETILQKSVSIPQQLEYSRPSGEVSASIPLYEVVTMIGAQHPSRHVKEECLSMIQDIYNYLTYATKEICDGGISLSLLASFAGFSEEVIAKAIEDEWCMTRLQGMKTLNSFLQYHFNHHAENFSLAFVQHEQRNFPEYRFHINWMKLLPRMMLNRFYSSSPAIQSLSLQVYNNYLLPNRFGFNLVKEYFLLDAAQYYMDVMRSSSNHMVVEAACLALREVVVKFINDAANCQFWESDAAAEIVAKVIVALRRAMEDERWPVKDNALLASAPALSAYHLCKTQRAGDVDEIIARLTEMTASERWSGYLAVWAQLLQDSIWSVREHAAMAVAEASVIDACSETVLDFAWRFVEEHLFDAFAHLSRDASAGQILRPENITSFLPAEFMRDYYQRKEHAEAATAPQTMAKREKKSAWSCCIDCVELRPAHRWEVSQAALYLCRELLLAQLSERSERELRFWREEILKERSFAHADNLQLAEKKMNLLEAFSAVLQCASPRDFDSEFTHALTALYCELPIIVNTCSASITRLQENHREAALDLAQRQQQLLLTLRESLQRELRVEDDCKDFEQVQPPVARSSKSQLLNRQAQEKAKLVAAKECYNQLSSYFSQTI